MIFHPLLRNLMLLIAAMTIIFVWSPPLCWDPRIIGTIVTLILVGLLLQTRTESSVSVLSQTSDSKRNELGFKVLSPGENPVVDIVAIHGLGGHRERSWTAANGKMWLKDFLADDIPNARILTYGHGADTHSHTYMPTQRLLHFAEGFVEDLLRVRRSNPERPIIFLAHSLGGIILKKALTLCNIPEYNLERRQIKVSTCGVLFFGTPHSGANEVGLARLVGKLLSVYMVTDDSMLDDLNHNSNELENIQTLYLYASEHIKSIFFYETDPTPMVTGIVELIVPRQSASIEGDRNAKVIPLDGNHWQLVKFERKGEVNYQKVFYYLSELVNEAPAEVERSWTEEKHHKNIRSGKFQPPSHSILPKSRLPVSRSYVRRPDIENFLTDKLISSCSPAVQPRCVLHGLGGSGKTQVALFWIEANEDKFTNIIFIDASSQKRIEADLETAIRSFGPGWSDAAWEDAVSYFSNKKGWLLFFDNANSLDLRLKDYLPKSIYGAVLITTRNLEYTIYAPDSHIRVGEMSQTEAVDLLHKVANFHPSSNDTSIAIVTELGMLALAVTQAGSYIFKTRQPDRYLGIFRKHRAQLMQEGSLQESYEESTYTTFDLSFRILPEISQEFMKICAFLHHSHIPQALFQKSIKNQFRSGNDIEGYPAMPEIDTLISSLKSIFGSEWDDFIFKKLIDPILQGSLIDECLDRDGEFLYNVHPLVQTYIQDLVIPIDQDRYALSAAQLLVGGIRHSKHDNKWDRELLPHIDNLPTRVKEAHISYATTFANVYESTGRWNDSVVLWKYCNIEVIKHFGLRDSRALSIRDRLGTALRECGEWKEAEKIEREVLELCKEVLGPRHPDVIHATHSLALTLGNRGQLEEAEKIEREVLELWKDILGPQHPYTIDAMNNLASILSDRGQLEEGEKVQREVLKLRNTIRAMNNLASTRGKYGQLEEAEKMKRKALELWKEILGPRHPDTILAMNNLAYTLSQRGQPEEAEKMMWEVVELRNEILGPRHPDTILAMNNFAYTLSQRGQPEEAEKIQREVLKLWKEVLGPRHPYTILAMNNLAVTLDDRGQLEEAEKIQREVLELRIEMLGPRHPDTILAMNNLAATLGERGRLEEAEKIQRQVLELQNEILGPRHPDTIGAMGNLAYTLGDLGELEEAERMKREVVELRSEILGTRHPDTILAMNSLASTLYSRSCLEEAEKIHQEVLKLYKEILGPRHPKTIITMKTLAEILRNRGQLEQAEKLEQDAVILQGESGL
ncbi:TPR-like protein [Serendipita vermifera]|nr:TPR-like protein [Serendipita vermifera]